jgi:hypothetical protein
LGVYAQVKSLNESGKTDEDKLREALELFSTSVNYPFIFLECWNMLKDCPKWKVPSCNSSHSASSVSLNSPSTSLQSPNSEHERPIGSKKAKYEQSVLKEKIEFLQDQAKKDDEFKKPYTYFSAKLSSRGVFRVKKAKARIRKNENDHGIIECGENVNGKKIWFIIHWDKFNYLKQV